MYGLKDSSWETTKITLNNSGLCFSHQRLHVGGCSSEGVSSAFKRTNTNIRSQFHPKSRCALNLYESAFFWVQTSTHFTMHKHICFYRNFVYAFAYVCVWVITCFKRWRGSQRVVDGFHSLPTPGVVVQFFRIIRLKMITTKKSVCHILQNAS